MFDSLLFMERREGKAFRTLNPTILKVTVGKKSYCKTRVTHQRTELRFQNKFLPSNYVNSKGTPALISNANQYKVKKNPKPRE